MHHKISFTGYYGMKNFGDDLFCWLSIKAADKYWKGNTLVVVAPPLKDLSCNYSVPTSLGKLYRSHDIFGKITRFIFNLKARLFSDKIVYAGGSLFSAKPTGVRGILDRVPLAELSTIGVSVGPFKTKQDKEEVINHLNRFKYVSVRDIQSYKYLHNSLNITNSSVDLAGLIPQVFDTKKENKTDYLHIGFSPCNWNQSIITPEEYCNAFIDSMKLFNITSKKIKLTLLSLNNHEITGDDELCLLIKNKLLNSQLDVEVVKYSDIGIKRTLDIINNFDAYISARLHGGICAYMLNTPFYLFEYHKKCVDFKSVIKYRFSYEGVDHLNFYEIYNRLVSSKYTIGLQPEYYSHSAVSNFTCAPWASKC
ncbi:polysaccharide pyruvyl transferase family protein [Vibrio breoganii]